MVVFTEGFESRTLSEIVDLDISVSEIAFLELVDTDFGFSLQSKFIAESGSSLPPREVVRRFQEWKSLIGIRPVESSWVMVTLDSGVIQYVYSITDLDGNPVWVKKCQVWNESNVHDFFRSVL